MIVHVNDTKLGQSKLLLSPSGEAPTRFSFVHQTLASILFLGLILATAFGRLQAASQENLALPRQGGEPTALSKSNLVDSLNSPPEQIGGLGAPIYRQVRATTRKHNGSSPVPSPNMGSTSTTEADTTTTTGAATTSSAAATSDDKDDEQQRFRRRKKPKVVATPIPAAIKRQDSATAADDDDDEDDQEEAEREKARRKRLRHNRNRNSTAEAFTSTSISTSTPTTSTTVPSPPKLSGTSNLANNSFDSGDKHGHVRGGGGGGGYGGMSAAQVPPLDKKKPLASGLDHEYFDDDDQELDQPLVRGAQQRNKPQVDFSKIKMVGLNQFNDSTPLTSDLSGPGFSAGHPNQPANLDRPNLDQMMPLSGGLGNLGLLEPLDARSPTGLAKRLTAGFLGDNNRNSSSRLKTTPTLGTTTSTLSTTTTSWSSPKFAYSKPFSTTTMMTPLASITKPVEVQVFNVSADAPMTAANFSQALDWSKLVKVVFRSAKDNQTIYTVVMNSSELSQHPISDWSQEMPQLLQRDFERLIQKWSHVFPMELLVSDLGRILVDKAALLFPNITVSLNQTLPVPSPHQVLPALLNQNQTGLTSNSTSNMPVAPPNTSNQTLTNSSPNLAEGLILNSQLASTSTTSRPLAVPYLGPTSTSTLAPISTSSPTAVLLQRPINSNNLTSSDQTNVGQLLTNTSMTSSSPRPLQITPDLFNFTTPWSSSLPSTTKFAGSGLDAANPQQIKVSYQDNDSSKQTTNRSAGHQHGSKELELEEHARIQSDVREQTEALRHFIVICSVSVVVATSLVVALIVLLFKK